MGHSWSTSGPRKLKRLISQLTILKSLGFMSPALPNREDTVASMVTSSLRDFPVHLLPHIPWGFPCDCCLSLRSLGNRCWDKDLGSGNCLGGTENSSRKVIQSTKGTLPHQLPQSSVLWKAVSDTHFGMLGPRARGLVHLYTNFQSTGWGLFPGVLIPGTNRTSFCVSRGAFHSSEKQPRAQRYKTGSLELAGMHWKVQGMCLGHLHNTCSHHTYGLRQVTPLDSVAEHM